MRHNFYLVMVIIILLVPLFGKSSGNPYDVRNIPADLLEDATAVIRLDYCRLEIEDEKTATMKCKLAVTILDKDREDEGELILHYDKFRSVEEIEGKLYNAQGEEIKEISGSDFNDYTDYTDFSLYSDDRIKRGTLYYDKLPYTVEFTYELSYDGYLDWPDWYTRSSLDPVVESVFEVVLPSSEKLRYWCSNDQLQPTVTAGKNMTTYRWYAANLPKLEEEAVNKNFMDVGDVVLIAPAKFEIEDFPGNLSSWKEFGSWIYNLYKGRDKLPAAAVEEIHELIKKDTDNIAKINRLYRYMQKKVRYVSVQLGIGGWQPFDAAYVHEHSYGDCKALSNYMVALLGEAGIKAYPVIITLGSYRIPVIKDFPSNQFNHVVVCVPLEKDTVWLECTSSDLLPGQLSYSTENRQGLLVTPEGGVLINTPVSSSSQNLLIRKINVALSQVSSAVEADIFFSGNQDNDFRGTINHSSPEEKEKYLISLFEAPSLKINKYSINISNSVSEMSSIKCSASVSNYASSAGDRIFFNPNITDRVTSVPKDVKKRLSPVSYIYPYIDVDSVFYTLPAGYKVEALSPDINVKSSFGEFTSKVISTNSDTLLYIRSLEIKNYFVSADKYQEYKKFKSDIAKADRGQVVLVKK